MDFLEHAIALDAYLVSDYPEIVRLGDVLFQEVLAADLERGKTVRERYKSKATLKILLVNLHVGCQSGVAIKYSRRKLAYSGKARYARIFFSYERVIPIIDKLAEMEYVEHWKGFKDRDKEIGRLSRMAAAPKLIELFEKYNVAQIQVKRSAPAIDDLIVCRDSDGNQIEIENTRPVELMRENLVRYNRFIEQQLVEYRLDGNTPVNLHFLHSLRQLACNGCIEITNLSTQADLTIKYQDNEYRGFEVHDKRFLLRTGDATEISSYLMADTRASSSNYPEYYKFYHNHFLSQYHQSTSHNSHPNTSPSPIPSMTGTFPEIAQQYQSSKGRKNDHGRRFVEDKVKRPLSDYGISELHFRSHYQYLHRVFNSKWLDAGGRFYGALQTRLPGAARKCIFINGSPTVELDYSAHHIRMLYHDCELDYQEDPYQILCAENPEERGIFKIVLLVSINAPNQESAVKAIRHEFWAKGMSGKYTTDEFIISCIEKFKEVHATIARYLNIGVGLGLQYTDSRITDKILNQMTRNGVPTLPVHDSYIVPVAHSDDLREVMVSAYEEVMGGFKPVIK